MGDGGRGRGEGGGGEKGVVGAYLLPIRGLCL